jgi:Radical SAM superfamily
MAIAAERLSGVIAPRSRGRGALDEQSVDNERELFDAAFYLQLHPDVAEAVLIGALTSAWDHYDRFGRAEGRRINERRSRFETLQDSQLNCYNFQTVMQNPPANYEVIRFDPNNTCNLHCVYCHNPRSDEQIDGSRFHEFLHTKVGRVGSFQVGCIMEPTMDKRLADFVLQIAESPAKPERDFLLQTNGILLHRHDHAKMRRAGLTRLSVSMDAANPETQKELRNGTSLAKVLRNVKEFMAACPETSAEFITTVTRSNIDSLSELVVLGLEMGIKRFIFREVFYYPDNNIVDHTRMPNLVLREGEFRSMKELVLGRFEGAAEFVFADNEELHESSKRMIEDSKLPVDLGPQFVA